MNDWGAVLDYTNNAPNIFGIWAVHSALLRPSDAEEKLVSKLTQKFFILALGEYYPRTTRKYRQSRNVSACQTNPMPITKIENLRSGYRACGAFNANCREKNNYKKIT